jgi:glycosyltransferase EpsD
MKVLFTASVMDHLTGFHVPYMQYFQDRGFSVHIACGAGEAPACVDRHFLIAFERSPLKLKNIASYRGLKKLINENAYDIIHCHTPVASVLTRLAARRARKRGTIVIYTAHGFHFYKGAPHLFAFVYRTVEKWLSRCTDILITINEEDFAAVSRYGFRPALGAYKVPGVGVDGTRFHPHTAESRRAVREQNGIAADAFVLIFAAEYNRNKNQAMLLRTVSLLKESIPGILLLLPGDGPLQPEYERLASELNISGHVRLLGCRTDIDVLLAAADVAVSSSRREGLGINLVEAMLTGLPVAATRIRGHVDIVKDGVSGFLIPPDDAPAMAEKLLALYNSPALRHEMGRKAISAAQPYRLESAQAETVRIYEHAINMKTNGYQAGGKF